MDNNTRIIVIGASAGGIPAVSRLLSGLSPDLNAAFFVVQHLSPYSNGTVIIRTWQRQTQLDCHMAEDGLQPERGTVYLAPPNNHMMLNRARLRVQQGARENKYRPSIDVLFRSAAVGCRNRVIGIILTGLLDDGTAGMWAIRRTGGICVVQLPAEAEFPDMPQSVLNLVGADYQSSLDEMPALIQNITANPLPPEVPVPEELRIEASLTEQMMSDINSLKRIADRSDFSCPECGGGLWAIKKDPAHRYRCHTGHVYTERALSEQQGESLEASVWVSIRMLEERHNLMQHMAETAREASDTAMEATHLERAAVMNRHIKILKELLIQFGRERGI